MQQLNFGRNITLTPSSFYTPKSEREAIEILEQNAGRRIRCVGRLHSWSRVLQCDQVLIDLRHLNQVQPVASGDRMTVRVGGGCQIKHLLGQLNMTGWTLPSVGFITEQTVAGAISTGTHGSGRHSLSHYVMSVRIARYDRISGRAVVEDIDSGDQLRAARCSLGCLGIILSVTMQCRPMYCVEEHFQEYDQLGDLLHAEKDYPLQQFYLVPWRWTYIAQHRREVDGQKSKTASFYHWYRFIVLDIAMHLLILLVIRVVRFRSAVRVLFRWVLPVFVVRGWRVVADSTKQLVMEHELFRHVEIELFVQRDRLDAALKFLQHALRVAGESTPITDDGFQAQVEESRCQQQLSRLRGTYCHHYPICIRRILPDDTLISMASNAEQSPGSPSDDPSFRSAAQTWYSITLTNYHRGTNRRAFEDLALFLAENMARRFGARPHWGKLCPLSPHELQKLYPALGRFRNVCTDADPNGLFGNQWTDSLLKSET